MFPASLKNPSHVNMLPLHVTDENFVPIWEVIEQDNNNYFY